MHPSADRDHGLRIDFSDNEDPILKGRIGARTRNTNAQFDNLILLPADIAATMQ